MMSCITQSHSDLYETLPTSSAVSSVSTLLKLELQPWRSLDSSNSHQWATSPVTCQSSGDMLILKPKYQLPDIIQKTSKAVLWIAGPVISP